MGRRGDSFRLMFECPGSIMYTVLRAPRRWPREGRGNRSDQIPNPWALRAVPSAQRVRMEQASGSTVIKRISNLLRKWYGEPSGVLRASYKTADVLGGQRLLLNCSYGLQAVWHLVY